MTLTELVFATDRSSQTSEAAREAAATLEAFSRRMRAWEIWALDLFDRALEADADLDAVDRQIHAELRCIFSELATVPLNSHARLKALTYGSTPDYNPESFVLRTRVSSSGDRVDFLVENPETDAHQDEIEVRFGDGRWRVADRRALFEDGTIVQTGL